MPNQVSTIEENYKFFDAFRELEEIYEKIKDASVNQFSNPLMAIQYISSATDLLRAIEVK